MKSIWWEQFFTETYASFNKTFQVTCFSSIVIRTIISIIFSFEIGFPEFQRKPLLGWILILFFLSYIEKRSILLKQFTLFIGVELLTLMHFSLSKNFTLSESLLFCLFQTIVNFLFQTSIFQELWISALIIVKHIYYWYSVFEKEPDSNRNYYISYLLAFFTFLTWMMFEKYKRNKLELTFYSNEEERKKNKQVSELLRLFHDGLIIMDTKMTVLYANETIKNLLKFEDFSEKIKEIKIKDGDSLFEIISGFSANSSNKIRSLGVTEIGNSLFEWKAQIVDWNESLCYMLTIKDVTTILKVERITTENDTKSALIRSISHELRTPVSGIVLIVDSLLQDTPEEFKERLSNIRICSELLNYQISDILDYSELVSGGLVLEKSFCDIKAKIKECINLVTFQANYKKLQIISNIDNEIPKESYTDIHRLQKIIMNLLSNAIKYTNKGFFEISAKFQSPNLEVSVRDTGIGIPQDRLGKIFDLFSDKESGMSGLGLHISKSILELMGSTLKVVSEVGKGSIFSFSIDIYSKISDPESFNDLDIPIEGVSGLIIRNFALESSVKNYPKVLIVDDNDFNRLVLGNMLKKRKIEYEEAINGKFAIELVIEADKNYTPFKCIIMDCNMPELDGWEATLTIRKIFEEGTIKNLPAVIGHTAYSAHKDIQRCFDCGMVSIILKPTSQENILDTISKFL